MKKINPCHNPRWTRHHRSKRLALVYAITVNYVCGSLLKKVCSTFHISQLAIYSYGCGPDENCSSLSSDPIDVL